MEIKYVDNKTFIQNLYATSNIKTDIIWCTLKYIRINDILKLCMYINTNDPQSKVVKKAIYHYYTNISWSLSNLQCHITKSSN